MPIQLRASGASGQLISGAVLISVRSARRYNQHGVGFCRFFWCQAATSAVYEVVKID